MEQKIKAYEAFIKRSAKSPTRDLAEYHDEMLRNFQHERLVHLLIMLFFVLLTLISVAGIFLFTAFCAELSVLIPLYLLTAILFVLTLAYIKHYHFLENHIQSLYKYNRLLHKL